MEQSFYKKTIQERTIFIMGKILDTTMYEKEL